MIWIVISRSDTTTYNKTSGLEPLLLTMNTQQQIWMLHLGAVKIPKEWYRPRIEEMQRVNQYSIVGYDRKTSVSRMKRAIYVMKQRYKVNSAKESYDILIQKKFIPYVAPSKHMGFERFRTYYYDLMKDPRIKTGGKKNKNYVIDNYRTKSIQEIADYLGKSRDYVKSTISSIRKENNE